MSTQKYVSLAYAEAVTAAWVSVWPEAERAECIRQVAAEKKAIKEEQEAAN